MDNKRGQILIEVIIACGLLVIGSLMLATFATNLRPLAKHGNSELQALFLAQEGIEATRSIRDNDFNFLTDGIHGIAFGTNTWAFSGNSDTQNEFSRQITVAPFDLRTKKITSTVTGPQSSVSLTTALLDIDQDIGMAHYITFDLTAANSLHDGNKELNGMVLKNIGPFPITISAITVWWNDSTQIQSIKLGSIVWAHNTIGLPAGKQPSGTLFDIVDYSLDAGASESTTNFTFQGPLNAVPLTFIVKFTFVDGSSTYVTLQPE